MTKKLKPPVYFDTMREAIDEAYRATREKGYEPVELAFMWDHVPYGETRDTHIDLTKDGKEQKKCLHVQLYRMETGRYELNFYLN